MVALSLHLLERQKQYPVSLAYRIQEKKSLSVSGKAFLVFIRCD